MSWQVRPITAGDIDAVLELAEITPEAPHWQRSEYECFGRLDESQLVRAGFVAVEEDRLLGFCMGTLVAGICELESVAVAADARRRGVATALLQELLRWAQSRQAVRLELEVRDSNYRAIRFYEKSGLACEGIRPNYYRSPDEDAVLMGMALANGGKNA
ncbi:MAG TPA: GNAT family N-acetyltransferase [Alloacidobacterium sp.]|nr:GNAT family N-acetyltransferase [Alloacidobacterium sp.]